MNRNSSWSGGRCVLCHGVAVGVGRAGGGYHRSDQVVAKVVECSDWEQTVSEAFTMGDNATISKILCKRKEGTEESNRRPKLGDLFSFIDNISEDNNSLFGTDPVQI